MCIPFELADRSEGRQLSVQLEIDWTNRQAMLKWERGAVESCMADTHRASVRDAIRDMRGSNMVECGTCTM